jgi:hypothetical protein
MIGRTNETYTLNPWRRRRRRRRKGSFGTLHARGGGVRST